jgi:hypothetical protein
MTRVLSTLLLAALLPMPRALAQAPSATEQAQKRLETLLQPGHAAEPAPSPTARPALRSPALPEAPLPRANLAPPLARPQGKPASPRPPREDAPLAHSFARPQPPQAVELAADPLVRLWGPDVQTPLPLPILGAAVRDRASLADPSLEASALATQGPVAVRRAEPVPFQPMNLPNPFEHAEAVRLRQPVEEQPAPPLTARPLSARH